MAKSPDEKHFDARSELWDKPYPPPDPYKNSGEAFMFNDGHTYRAHADSIAFADYGVVRVFAGANASGVRSVAHGHAEASFEDTLYIGNVDFTGRRGLVRVAFPYELRFVAL